LLLANLHFQLAYKLPAICNSFALCLQLQLAFKCPQFAIRLIFVYNFNWHSNWIQSTINLLLANLHFQLAFHLSKIYNQLDLYNTTTSTGIQMPAICNSFALCLQFQLACQCPQFAIRLLFAYSFNWHINCLQFAIRCYLPTTSTGIQIACKLQFICSLPTTTILQLDSRTCICFMHNASER